MKNEWIIDVLTDLRAFAQTNGLSGLADQLDDTRMIAAAEIGSSEKGLLLNDSCSAIAAGPATKRFGGRV